MHIAGVNETLKTLLSGTAIHKGLTDFLRVAFISWATFIIQALI